MKTEIRVLGIDDAPFKKTDKETRVIAPIFRGGTVMDGVLSTKVAIDGDDATQKFITMINRCKFKPQLQCILLDGIAVAGLNVIDIKLLHKKTKIPIIVVMRKYPDFKGMQRALAIIGKPERFLLIQRAGTIEPYQEIFIQRVGIPKDKAQDILKLTCTRSFIPEPIRAAHLIAAGITLGESKGRA